MNCLCLVVVSHDTSSVSSNGTVVKVSVQPDTMAIGLNNMYWSRVVKSAKRRERSFRCMVQWAIVQSESTPYTFVSFNKTLLDAQYMSITVLASPAVTQNAKVAAISLTTAAFMVLVLSHVHPPLAPLRLLVLALAAFAVWAFCDEMGMRKPLNRAGFVFFSMAAVAKIQLSLGVAPEFAGRYYLLYSTFLLLSLLLWSVAFLHRQRSLKVLGAVGAVATLLPIFALLLGHLAVGAGAALGIGAFLAATDGATPTDLGFVTLVERIFGIWGYITAWLLWRGHMLIKVSGC